MICRIVSASIVCGGLKASFAIELKASSSCSANTISGGSFISLISDSPATSAILAKSSEQATTETSRHPSRPFPARFSFQVQHGILARPTDPLDQAFGFYRQTQTIIVCKMLSIIYSGNSQAVCNAIPQELQWQESRRKVECRTNLRRTSGLRAAGKMS